MKQLIDSKISKNYKEGQVESVQVIYTVTIVTAKDAYYASFKIDTDEIIDFESALNEDLFEDVVSDMIEDFEENYDLLIHDVQVEVTSILYDVKNDDGSEYYMVFEPDGSFGISFLSAEDIFELELIRLRSK